MKKILLFLGISALLLVGATAVADEPVQPVCSEGEHFEGSYECVEYSSYCVEYSEECISYAEPTYQCPVGYGDNPQYESPNWCNYHSCPGNDDKWEKPCSKVETTLDCGWEWVGNWPHQHLEWVCEENSQTLYTNKVEVAGECIEYACSGYGEFCSASDWVGSCVLDESDEGKNESEGGASFIQYLPKVASNANIDGRTVSFLSSHYGVGGILLDSESIPFPVDIWGQPLPSYFDAEFNAAAVVPLDYTFGYEYGFVEDLPSVYHSITLPDDFPAGDYYARLYFKGYNYGFGNYPLAGQFPTYGPILSQEVLIHIE